MLRVVCCGHRLRSSADYTRWHRPPAAKKQRSAWFSVCRCAVVRLFSCVLAELFEIGMRLQNLTQNVRNVLDRIHRVAQNIDYVSVLN